MTNLEDIMGSLPREEKTDNLKSYFVIKRKGMVQYLKAIVGSGWKEEDKWTADTGMINRFLGEDGTRRYAKRILGHDDFEVIEMKLPSMR